MAQQKRKKKKLYVSPKGIAVWPRLWAPDTKYKKEGQYSTKVTYDLNQDDVQAMVEMFDKAMVQSFKDAEDVRDAAVAEARAAKQKLIIKPTKAADPPYVKDEEGGVVQVNYKMTASGKREDGTTWTQKPTGFDGMGTPITTDMKIGGGSLIRVGYNMDLFSTPAVGAGITLRLKSYQLLTLVEYGGVTFEDSGFGVEDGGFSVGDMTEEEEATNEAAPADEAQAEEDDHTDDDF